MGIHEKVEAHAGHVIELRRQLHRHPEAGAQEFATAALVRAELDRLGIEWRVCGGKTGTLATIHGAKPGKTILMRGDMDALPVTEETGLPFASEVKGMMHACGHDAHTSMLMGTAEVLNELRGQLCGTVKLAFQPGEEICYGAHAMIEEGALEGVDACFGLHVMGTSPAGTIQIPDGPYMAACNQFTIKVTGVSGHASAPQMSVDAAYICAEILNNLQSIVSRETDPLKTAVVTVGRMEAGTRWNVIAGTGVLEGTTRTYDPAINDALEQQVPRIAAATAEMLRGKAETDYKRLCGVCINDPAVAKIMRGAAAAVVGKDNIDAVGILSGSEDFAEFAERCPSSFAGLGINSKDCCYPNHHGKFCFDEKVLSTGVELYCRTAFRFLNGSDEI